MSNMKQQGLLVAVVVAALWSALALGSCVASVDEQKEPDFSNAGYVCELTTLQVYYHNVAQAFQAPNGMFFGVGDIGYKKMWFEYSGIVEVGIDVSKVNISQPDASNVVTITLPQAEIMDVVIVQGSLGDPVMETGWFTNITTEEKTEALGEAQNSMEEAAEQDESIKFQARERARDMLESYVVNVGDLLGEEYTISWVDV